MPPTLSTSIDDPRMAVIGGRRVWQFPDGTILPVISGGSGDGAGGDAGDGDLGDTGKKALDSERAARRDADKARKAAEARAKELEDRLAKLEEGSKSEHEKALEKATKDAAESARKEATAAANARIVRAEIKAAASGKLADANDALRLLDLDEFEVDDDGNVDPKAVSKAIDELVKSKPYLAAGGGKRFQGGGDGGNRGGDGSGEKVAPGVDRLRHAYANSPSK